ncbi:STAS domain-containing protein [Actinoplanes sp. NBC_00393]|uniref:STAS domain-containing protein n=1 Tax=Actinoplanes sp. NBC_00393 TaxID=2975953 RepID=UPI002E2020CF
MDLRTAPPAHRHDLHIIGPTAVDGHAVTLYSTGVLDGLNTDQLVAAFRATLDDPAADPIDLDINGLTFLDSGGIRALLRCRTVARAAGRHLRLRDPAPPVRQVLAITGLIGVFDLVE